MDEPARSSAVDLDATGGTASTPTGDGLVGLYNLGNTCYLNASIQCLSHTPLLTQYFLTKSYLRDLNTANVLGHQGKLAHAFASLVQQLWSTKKKALNPRVFKSMIAKSNELFAGNDQHDAQELLSFLLSGLSEDLNRIEKKPYIEQPDRCAHCAARRRANFSACTSVTVDPIASSPTFGGRIT
jgi:ubiquitin C-terminal hydrolase